MSAVDGDSGHGYKSIPPVAFIHESARGAVERKSQTRSCCCCHVSSDDVRRTSFKLLTELMVTRCKELLISVMPEMRTLNSVKDVLSFDAFVGCQITTIVSVSRGFGTVWGLSGVENMVL